MNEDAARLHLDALTLGYNGGPVIEDLSLDVDPGEVLVVVGASGCGKSTLLRAIAGLLRPLSGTVVADGHSVTSPSADRALVFQDDALLPWRTARRNVELPLALRGVPRDERRRSAAEWLRRVGLAGHEDRLPGQLSGGMRQRVQLARALAGEPRVICMDEPFGALDAQTRASMQRLLVEAWQTTGCTVVFVTHDVDEALAIGDRIAVLGPHGVTAQHRVPRPRDLGAAPDTGLRTAVVSDLAATRAHPAAQPRQAVA
jgi:sulfonate transport system ATP-binding protein